VRLAALDLEVDLGVDLEVRAGFWDSEIPCFFT